MSVSLLSDSNVAAAVDSILTYPISFPYSPHPVNGILKEG
jgi:hypothetical protein